MIVKAGAVIEAFNDAGLLPPNCGRVEIVDDYNTGEPLLVKFTCFLKQEDLQKLLEFKA